ncbi:energy-coupling factor transporter ATP-binding protein EcfA2 [Zhihengliuella flava]|uniref:Energy-coupling factor transporter ATP-binding protein EcfA2 n=1 Tax=Zhihengliuella flava TaxID=1285193 RepID=A0A931GE16_9MICC|nr:energy-coupling factor transporter ATP-binding protein EcfA2 [Zhihengliuella flava]
MNTVSATGLVDQTLGLLDATDLPLAAPAAAAARDLSRHLALRLRDHVRPRLSTLGAPLLCVVGGSTGAGKSTLVNALVGRPVTRAGAIRPTTRQPVLIHAADDAPWFLGENVLPGLRRTRGSYTGRQATPSDDRAPSSSDAATDGLLMVQDGAVPRGLGLLDAPDIDSVEDANRQLAGQLLAAADLWMFVTTANRYADAVGWGLLADAAARDVTVAVVLDRVPEGAAGEVSAHLREMLIERGLAHARLFVIAEQPLDEQRMLPDDSVAELRQWLTHLGSDAEARRAIAARTLAGSLRQASDDVARLAEAVAEQRDAEGELCQQVRQAYAEAAQAISEASANGTLLRGEVLARWQDVVGTGEFFRSVESTISRVRDRVGAFFTGRPAPVDSVEEAIETGLHAVIVDAAAGAAEGAAARWRTTPAGRELIAGRRLDVNGEGFSERAATEVRAWQGDLLELIRAEGQGKRFAARMLSLGVNGIAVALMVVVFASTAGLTGLEIGIAGGSAVVGQKLLESIFGEDAVRRLAKKARGQLDERVRALLEADARRFTDLLGDAPTQPAEFDDVARRLAALSDQLSAGASATGEENG